MYQETEKKGGRPKKGAQGYVPGDEKKGDGPKKGRTVMYLIS